MTDPTTDTPARAKPLTLRRRIDNLGPCYLEAFDRARKTGGAEYEAKVREAMDAADLVTLTETHVNDAKFALMCAMDAHAAAQKRDVATRPILDALTAKAKALHAIDHPD